MSAFLGCSFGSSFLNYVFVYRSYTQSTSRDNMNQDDDNPFAVPDLWRPSVFYNDAPESSDALLFPPVDFKGKYIQSR